MNKDKCQCVYEPGRAFAVENIGDIPICLDCNKPIRMAFTIGNQRNHINKVYCKGCKWVYAEKVCSHPDNKRDTAYEPISKSITESNKNNDCKLYEVKEWYAIRKKKM